MATHRSHSDRDSVYKWHKNRKKTIRQMWQRGSIDEHRRQALLQEAREKAEAMRQRQDEFYVSEKARNRAHAEQWLLTNTPPDREAAKTRYCVEECIAARSYRCSCRCDGANHGAAWGRQPWEVESTRMTKTERAAKGHITPDQWDEYMLLLPPRVAGRMNKALNSNWR